MPPTTVPDDPAVLGYLAGIIDGEGCIGITSAKGPGSRNRSHALRLHITNTSDALMVWLIETFGSGRRSSRNEKPGKWATRYDWMVYGFQAEALLEAVLPYLVIKKAQARLALEFRAVGGRDQKPYQRKRGGAPALDESVVIEREELKRRMSVLNRRGPTSTGEGAMNNEISVVA